MIRRFLFSFAALFSLPLFIFACGPVADSQWCVSYHLLKKVPLEAAPADAEYFDYFLRIRVLDAYMFPTVLSSKSLMLTRETS
jgi:hypothetical protein